MQDLITTIFSTFSANSIEVTYHIDQIIVPTKTAIPLGLIINEIATNTLKHGQPLKDRPRSTTELKKYIQQNRYVLTLSNNGPPLPKDINLENPGTLGLQLISALVDQLEGTLLLQKEPHPVFTIQFPRENDQH